MSEDEMLRLADRLEELCDRFSRSWEPDEDDWRLAQFVAANREAILASLRARSTP